MTPPTLVEACCDSVRTARAAQRYGAGRVELCGPGEGGTTPSLGLIARCRNEITIPLHVMIRPHTNSFLYDEDDMDVMCNDIVAAKTLGVDGIVLGPLHSDHTVDTRQLAAFVTLARPMKVAFHRAFDRTPDALETLEQLLRLDVDYILTSGHGRTALDGAATLQALQARAGDQLVVLAGGHVRAENVHRIIELSHVREVHARATDPTIVRDVVQALATR
ncbi:copper homeostasis protein CutC [Gemmatimonas sp.]|uniref:copper homeostasis protein CutC n=1 Tax=Gemmatimonas sp. TaxID=1962908 RepID=UPI00286B394B|nr:copper homeostasis protein CutC [Gemmatimonas sp.]